MPTPPSSVKKNMALHIFLRSYHSVTIRTNPMGKSISFACAHHIYLRLLYICTTDMKFLRIPQGHVTF